MNSRSTEGSSSGAICSALSITLSARSGLEWARIAASMTEVGCSRLRAFDPTPGRLPIDRRESVLPQMVLDVALLEAEQPLLRLIGLHELRRLLDVSRARVVAIGEQVPPDTQLVGKLGQRSNAALGKFDHLNTLGVEIVPQNARKFRHEPELGFPFDQDPDPRVEDHATQGAYVVSDAAAIIRVEGVAVDSMNDALLTGALDTAKHVERHARKQCAGVGRDQPLGLHPQDQSPDSRQEHRVQVSLRFLDDDEGHRGRVQRARPARVENRADEDEQADRLGRRAMERDREGWAAAEGQLLGYAAETLDEFARLRVWR